MLISACRGGKTVEASLNLKAWQAERLFDLYFLERVNESVVKGLEAQLRRAEIGMSKGEVARVKELVANVEI
jgi:hypothetical protein